MLLSALVVHGYITDDLSLSTVLPIPKGSNLNYSDSANYRGIALSSIIGKIYDLYVLRYESLLTRAGSMSIFCIDVGVDFFFRFFYKSMSV